MQTPGLWLCVCQNSQLAVVTFCETCSTSSLPDSSCLSPLEMVVLSLLRSQHPTWVLVSFYRDPSHPPPQPIPPHVRYLSFRFCRMIDTTSASFKHTFQVLAFPQLDATWRHLSPSTLSFPIFISFTFSVLYSSFTFLSVSIPSFFFLPCWMSFLSFEALDKARAMQVFHQIIGCSSFGTHHRDKTQKGWVDSFSQPLNLSVVHQNPAHAQWTIRGGGDCSSSDSPLAETKGNVSEFVLRIKGFFLKMTNDAGSSFRHLYKTNTFTNTNTLLTLVSVQTHHRPQQLCYAEQSDDAWLYKGWEGRCLELGKDFSKISVSWLISLTRADFILCLKNVPRSFNSLVDFVCSLLSWIQVLQNN